MPRFLLAVLLISALSQPAFAGPWSRAAQQALVQADANRSQLEKAIAQTPEAERYAMEFLVAFMPARDLKTLSADFLLENHRLAFEAWQTAPWKDSITQDLFLNYVLPYANLNEGRQAWRAQFRKQFLPLVAEAESASEATAILNQKIFPLLKVKYSTKRKRADQAPLDSINSGLASCTGLSILLIDACRSVGIPARFVGTPLWSDNSGNHSWVEAWDDGWHFTGAAEPTGDALDRAWFVGRASKAQRDHRLHAIYAVRFQHTPQSFPLVWDPSIQYVYCTNVTERYLQTPPRPVPSGHAEVMLRVVDATGERVAAKVLLKDQKGKVIFEGTSKDERFDRNDHLVAVAPTTALMLQATHPTGSATQRITPKADQTVTVTLQAPAKQEAAQERQEDTPAESAKKSAKNSATIAKLTELLADKDKSTADILKQLHDAAWADQALSKQEAQQAEQLLWNHHQQHIRKSRAAEMKAKKIQVGDLTMPFFYKVFGDKPADGRSLFISMHGGGGAPPQVNDSQWENQKRLYQLKEGVYLAPRAPTNTWNLWHQGHVDGMFRRLIENLIVFEDVNPDKVYIMGYSAGGDGVFQLAPRMADSLAAAAMMAGHPNETSPLGLRNLPFTLHMGGRDAAYKRNEVAAQWEKKLADLRKKDPQGYEHWVKIYPDKGHWMDREDAAAIPWMAKRKRQRHPDQIVWKQDDVTHSRFYWLAVDEKNRIARSEVRAQRDGQTFQVQFDKTEALKVRLNDVMVDLDQPVIVKSDDEVLFQGKAKRSLRTIADTLVERGDPRGMFSAEVVFNKPKS